MASVTLATAVAAGVVLWAAIAASAFLLGLRWAREALGGGPP